VHQPDSSGDSLMAATVRGYKAIMTYREKIWHVDYENTYPDVELDKGMCHITVIYGDCNSRSLIHAMTAFASKFNLELDYQKVKLVKEGPQS
jgi:purine nucleoside permease